MFTRGQFKIITNKYNIATNKAVLVVAIENSFKIFNNSHVTYALSLTTSEQ